MDSPLNELTDSIRAVGVIDAEAVRRLRDALTGTGALGMQEADLLLALHAETAQEENDPSWPPLLAESLAGYLLGPPEAPDVVDDDRAAHLLSRLGPAADIGELERELLAGVAARAASVPDCFLDYVLAALGHAVRTEGRVDERRVEQLRRVVYRGGRAGDEGVERRMADFLFDLNDAVTGRPNHPSWTRLFVGAVRSHVLDDDDSPGQVDAAETEWLVGRMEADRQYDPTERALLTKIKHFIQHDEVWGGIRSDDLQASTDRVVASLYSRACQGGKGGDLYYFSVSASDVITRIALADVSGHGPAVSDMSQWIYDSLAARMDSAEGSEVLADLNRLAADRGYKALTTAVVVTLDRPESKLYFAYAGHPPMFLRRKADGRWRRIQLEEEADVANLPLGVDPDVRYDQQGLALARGDRLFLYTDGVVEAPGTGGRIFGAERLLGALDARPDGPPRDVKNAVVAAIEDYTGGRMDHDDVTLMVVEVL